MIKSIYNNDRTGAIRQLHSRVGKLLIKARRFDHLFYKKESPCERRVQIESIGVLPRGMEFFTQFAYVRKLPLGPAKDPRI
jgi:hypothetical protein